MNPPFKDGDKHGLSLCIQGTRITAFIEINNTTVYPCVYREHQKSAFYFVSFAGLSLCIQGTLVALPPPRMHQRFIPVYTGNTSGNALSLAIIAVYPCVYREHITVNEAKKCGRGLSLCIQGTRLNNEIFQLIWRFIPVYTGNTKR